MKKILLILTFVAVTFSNFAQVCDGIVWTTNPPEFTAEDEVTLIVDLKACSASWTTGDVYLWMWSPDPVGLPDMFEGASAGNGDWSNSNSALKMTKQDDGTYTFTFTPVILYKKSPAEITSFNFLVKAKDGSGDNKTPDQTCAVKPLIFVDYEGRIFPDKVSINDVITLYLNQEIASKPEVKYFNGDLVLKITAYDEADLALGATKSVQTSKETGDFFDTYSVTFMPAMVFTDITDLKKVKKIIYTFENADGKVKTDPITKQISNLD